MVSIVVLQESLAEKIKKFIFGAMEMNIWVLLVHVMCAILIIACISVWVWKPTNEFISQQKRKLDKEKNDLVVNNREARYFLGLLKKEKHELFYTRRAITKAAAEEAERIREEAKVTGEKIVADLQAKAEDRISMMERKARHQIKKYIIDSAVELTEKLVDANLDDAKNKAVIDAYIKELEDKKVLEGDDRKLF